MKILICFILFLICFTKNSNGDFLYNLNDTNTTCRINDRFTPLSKEYVVYMDNVKRLQYGNVKLYVKEHISIYVGKIKLKNNKIEFIPDDKDLFKREKLGNLTNEEIGEERAIVQKRLFDYIEQINLDKNVSFKGCTMEVNTNDLKFIRFLSDVLGEKYSVWIGI
jgi:hypothetical protein